MATALPATAGPAAHERRPRPALTVKAMPTDASADSNEGTTTVDDRRPADRRPSVPR